MSFQFWFEFASTYSYPAAMRIESLALSHGVQIEWDAFILGPVFKAQGWNDSPFNIYPAKGRYMWRDMERLCEKERLPLKLPPASFPQNGLKAARLALVGEKQGWIEEFSKAVFVANFAEQRNISDDSVLAEIMNKVGAKPNAVVEANSDENKAALRAQTDDAIARGIFGAPSFTIGSELFWGNDRLEDAIAWAKRAGV